jgi:hypothetical protein
LTSKLPSIIQLFSGLHPTHIEHTWHPGIPGEHLLYHWYHCFVHLLWSFWPSMISCENAFCIVHCTITRSFSLNSHVGFLKCQQGLPGLLKTWVEVSRTLHKAPYPRFARFWKVFLQSVRLLGFHYKLECA